VASATERSTRADGDVRAVVRHILTSDAFAGSVGGRVKRPFRFFPDTSPDRIQLGHRPLRRGHRLSSDISVPYKIGKAAEVKTPKRQFRPMTESELERFRAMLERMLAELADQNELGRDGRKTVELDQQSVGRLSRMDALQQQAMAKAMQSRRGISAARIRAALSRIADGDFGYCADCGDKIEVPRLELDPTAPKCVSCARG